MAGVYIITQVGIGGKQPVKIGVADNVRQRLKELQTGNPYELEVLAVIPCKSRSEAFSLESIIHKEMEKNYFRLKGEWFQVTNGWLKNINEIITTEKYYTSPPKIKAPKADYIAHLENKNRKLKNQLKGAEKRLNKKLKSQKEHITLLLKKIEEYKETNELIDRNIEMELVVEANKHIY